MKTRSFPYLFALLAALVMIYALWRYDRFRQSDYQQDMRATTSEEMQQLANRLLWLVDWRLSVGRTLAAYASINPTIAQEEFSVLGYNLVDRENSDVILWIALIRDGQFEFVHASHPFNPLQGRPLSEYPRIEQAADLAATRQELAIQGPFPSTEGDYRVVAVVPVFTAQPGQEGDEELWGMAAMEFRLNPLLSRGRILVSRTDLLVALRKKAYWPDERPVLLFGQPSVFENNPVVADLDIGANGRWEIAAIPFNGWDQPAPGTVRFWTVGLALVFTISLFIWFFARIPAQLSRAVRTATSALRESEERFRSLFEATFEAVMVHDNGIILDVNQAFERTFGYTTAEAIGSQGHDLTIPSQRSRVLSKIAMHDDKPYELKMIRKDGSTFDAEVVGKDHVYRGRLVRVVAIRDITARKEVERTLRQRIQFEALVNSISAHFINQPPETIGTGIEQGLETLGKDLGADASYLIYLADPPHNQDLVYEWNAAGTEAPFGGLERLTEENAPWLFAQLRDNQILRISSLADLPPEAAAERELLSARSTTSLVCMPLHAGGKTIGFLAFESRRPGMQWSDDQISQLRIVSEMFSSALERKRADDVLRKTMADLDSANRLLQQYSANLKTMVEERTAELEQEREKALQASRAKSDFLSTMSHELRTPLNSILGLAQVVLMRMKPHLPDQQKENLRAIIASGKRLLDLINQLLDLSRIEEGRTDVRLTHFPVNLPLVEAFESVRPLAERKNLRYLLNNQTTGVHLRSDNDKLVQILINLLGNAVKFTNSGEIELTVAEEFDGITFAVRDTGIGISPDQQKEIFEPFRQADSSSTRRHGGSGLGLSISRRLAELLGGTLTLQSEPGKGSTFRLWVPRNVSSDLPAARIGA